MSWPSSSRACIQRSARCCVTMFKPGSCSSCAKRSTSLFRPIRKSGRLKIDIKSSGDWFAKKQKLLSLLRNTSMGRTTAELHEIIEWLTGYDEAALQKHLAAETTFEDFFAGAELEYERRAHHRRHLRHPGGDHRRSAHAEDSLPGQACRRAGQGQEDGEDSPLRMSRYFGAGILR